MRGIGARFSTMLGALSLLLGTSGCVLIGIDAGYEGVMVEKPFFVGHGGVDPVPAGTGRILVAITTEVEPVDIRPVKHEEHFDIVSAENTPVSFDAHIFTKVIEGRSPELIARFGPHWYKSYIQNPFRTAIREEVQKFPLFELTTKPGVREKIQTAVENELKTKIFQPDNVPVQLIRIVVGSIMPPKGVLEQTELTQIQQQRVLTMREFEKAETARERAERQRGIADRAYREHLGLTAIEFVDLRRIEVQKEIMNRTQPGSSTLIMGLERIGINLPPISNPMVPAQ